MNEPDLRPAESGRSSPGRAVQVRRARFDADLAAIRRVRLAVFVEEQGVPIEIELDDRDPHCAHVLAHDAAGLPIGTGRIDLDADGKIGRVAVLAGARGTGVGTALMACLHGLARAAALPSVWCNAQRSAEPFYSKLGYVVTAGPFYEAGIEHLRMHREIEAADGGTHFVR